MPPDTSSAMRRPRSSSGTGVASSGIAVRLSLALPRILNERQDLGHRTLELVVDDHVIVVRRVSHLDLGDLAPRQQLLERLAVAQLLAPLECLRRRRHDEDEESLGRTTADLLGALHLDLQNDVVPRRTSLL